MRKQTAELLEYKAKQEEEFRTNVINKLESMGKEIHVVSMSTNQLPQLIANLDALSQRLRIIEDFKIRAIFIMAFVFLIFGFLNFAFWKWADHFFK